MKIGILTQPLHNNYGGLMQNYALHQVLRSMGVEPETIDHGSRSLGWLKVYMSRCKQWMLLHTKSSQRNDVNYQLSKKESLIIGRNTRYFTEKYIKHTFPFKSPKELLKIVNQGGYDGFVVGSDQCWRPSYSGGFLEEMFLNFVENTENIIRVAYAVSFGTDEWEYSNEMTAKCAKLAKKFNIITVRELSGVDLCKNNLGVDAVHVLDPTMLLEKKHYEELIIKENEPLSAGDLFYYILDPSQEKKDFIDKIAHSENLAPYTIMPRYQAGNRTYNNVKSNIDDCVYPSVTSWLRGFMDAKLVLVDSFHGAVFSIIFNKPFWVIENSKRGNARFNSLLKLFHLEDRMISSGGYDSVDLKACINWDEVNSILQNERSRCISLLENTFNV